MDRNTEIKKLRREFAVLSPHLNEKAARLWAASKSQEYGRGGISLISAAIGLSRTTIYVGLSEIEDGSSADVTIRSAGGGRKSIIKVYPRILIDLESLIDPVTRGDPESPLRWTCKSTRNIAAELMRKYEYKITQRTVCNLLEHLEYSLQSNRKILEGKQHIDRNAQFEFIAQLVKTFQEKHCPVISVDTKKKELVGNFKNSGKELRPSGNPEKVLCYDFLSNAVGKIAPYGIYDVTNNKGWVSVNMSSDTAQFAVNTIRTWWTKVGRSFYSDSKEILITADGGGSNGSRVRLWKLELQKFANETGLVINVCHFPPGTSKWNKIEHKLFSFITKNWQGKPLIDIATILNLIGNTTNKKGLLVYANLDNNIYEKGIKVNNKDFAEINLELNDFHGEWNYKILPNVA